MGRRGGNHQSGDVPPRVELRDRRDDPGRRRPPRALGCSKPGVSQSEASLLGSALKVLNSQLRNAQLPKESVRKHQVVVAAITRLPSDFTTGRSNRILWEPLGIGVALLF